MPGAKREMTGKTAEKWVVSVQFSRQHVVDLLRRTGMADAADEAERVLPDPVDLEYLTQWGAKHGVSRDDLISQMGGSP